MVADSQKQVESLKNNSYMNLVDWRAVHSLSGMNSIEQHIASLDNTIASKLDKEKQAAHSVYQLKDKGQLTSLLDQEADLLSDQEKPLLAETRSRYISILQQTYAE